MILKKVDPNVAGNELFFIDNEAFNREFDLKARSVKEEVDYLKNSEVYIAYEDNTTVGLIGYQIKQGYVEIMSLAVIPAYQKKGIAKDMLTQILNMLNGKEIRLVTHPKNTPAIILYLKFGFIIYGWKDDYYGDGQPRMLLKRNTHFHQ